MRKRFDPSLKKHDKMDLTIKEKTAYEFLLLKYCDWLVTEGNNPRTVIEGFAREGERRTIAYDATRHRVSTGNPAKIGERYPLVYVREEELVEPQKVLPEDVTPLGAIYAATVNGRVRLWHWWKSSTQNLPELRRSSALWYVFDQLGVRKFAEETFHYRLPDGEIGPELDKILVAERLKGSFD